jgi:hypothetical protein
VERNRPFSLVACERSPHGECRLRKLEMEKIDLMRLRTIPALVAVVLTTSTAVADHYYGLTPTNNDPPIDVITGTLFGNGSISGLLAASAPQPDEGFDHVVFYANAGDNITVDTIGSNMDPGLAILTDVGLDGIFVGDAPPDAGSELALLSFDDDGAGGLNSLIIFVAPYTGAYLASIAEISGNEMDWTINVQGSTFVPEPSTLALAAFGFGALAALGRRRRR